MKSNSNEKPKNAARGVSGERVKTRKEKKRQQQLRKCQRNTELWCSDVKNRWLGVIKNSAFLRFMCFPLLAVNYLVCMYIVFTLI